MVNPEDRPYLRFLWRNSPSEELKVYEFSRCVFGLSSSPFVAQYVSQHNAKENLNTLPVAAEAVLNNCFMDDILKSYRTEKEVEQFYKQSIDLWGKLNMKPHKWLTNSDTVRSVIPDDLLAQKPTLDISGTSQVKTLGLVWNSESDEMNVRVKPDCITKYKISKRGLSGAVPGLFDPLGLLSPLTLEGKLIIQQAWIDGVDWDDSLSPHLSKRAEAWLQDIQDTESITFSRCVDSLLFIVTVALLPMGVLFILLSHMMMVLVLPI